MKIIYNKKDKAANQPTGEKENRFSRLVNRFDINDRELDPRKRKRKWFFILSGIFILYLLSFLIPSPRLSHQQIESGNQMPGNSVSTTPKTQKALTFEMPVDSFETILKKNIDEKLSKKK